MPREVQTEEEFLALVDRAIECRVKRLHDTVKLKLRTRRYLYTYKCDTATAERVIGRLKIPIVDV
jgi:large subunit ribosomal protein L38e